MAKCVSGLTPKEFDDSLWAALEKSGHLQNLITYVLKNWVSQLTRKLVCAM